MCVGTRHPQFTSAVSGSMNIEPHSVPKSLTRSEATQVTSARLTGLGGQGKGVGGSNSRGESRDGKPPEQRRLGALRGRAAGVDLRPRSPNARVGAAQREDAKKAAAAAEWRHSANPQGLQPAAWKTCDMLLDNMHRVFAAWNFTGAHVKCSESQIHSVH